MSDFIENKVDDGKELHPDIIEEEKKPALKTTINEVEKTGTDVAHIINNIFAKKENLTDKDKETARRLTALAEKLKLGWEEVVNLTEATIIASKELPWEREGAERMSQEEKKSLNTTYEDKKSALDNERVQEKISDKMQKGIALVFSALSEREYPAGLIGSNAFVLEAGKKTSKLPDDIDVIGSINDFPQSYELFKKMEEEGIVKKLELIPMTTIKGEKNGCYEVRGQVKSGDTEDDTIGFSVYFQSINPEEENNGYVNIGKENTSFHMYEFKTPTGETVEIPIATQDTSELLYLKNTLNEIRLFMFEVYEVSRQDFPYMSPKSLQRLSNLAILNDYNFDKVIGMLGRGVDAKHKEQLLKAKELIENLQKEFKANEHLSGKGLAEDICGIEFAENCHEKAVDLVTKEVQSNMKKVFDIYENAKKVFDGKKSTMDQLNEIKNLMNEVNLIYDEYSKRISTINNRDQKEFVLFVAMRALKTDFLKPVLGKLALYKTTLEKELKN